MTLAPVVLIHSINNIPRQLPEGLCPFAKPVERGEGFLDHFPSTLSRFFKPEKRGEGLLPFFEVAPDIFPELFLFSGHIQDVVSDLKREPHHLTVAGERRELALAGLCIERPDPD